MATRDQLIAALARRYGEEGRIERGRILDEFVAVTATIASTPCACCG
jgi:hypothetical protein